MAVPTLKRCRGQMRNRKSHSAHPKRRRPVGVIASKPPFLEDAVVATLYMLDPVTNCEYGIDLLPGYGIQVTTSSTSNRWYLDADGIVDLAIAAGIDRRGG
ncbi:hypothetical protein [Stenotrophomonas muris]|uniref:hypothetical protein n=1 Tax=Stenotrophomonas muris TaxID=2963283 RepID=UPI0038C158E6